MTISLILLQRSVGEARGVAFTADGQPCALFIERSGIAQPARLGQTYEARLRALAPLQGGGFAELETGEEVFLQTRQLKGLTEGQSLIVCIDSEARRGKLARARVAAKMDPHEAAFTRWVKGLPSGHQAELKDAGPSDADVQAAFDEALSPDVTLPGGGKLRIDRTRALTAIDIDTAGREDRGRPNARARAINIEAAEETARQLALRGLGGAAVLDCVAPLTRQHGGDVKAAFLQTFRAISARKAEALAPSPFGLMEAATAWGWQPAADLILDATGRETPLSQTFAAIRAAETEAAALPGAAFALNLPAAWALTDKLIKHCQQGLNDRYGARILISQTDTTKPEIIRT